MRQYGIHLRRGPLTWAPFSNLIALGVLALLLAGCGTDEPTAVEPTADEPTADEPTADGPTADGPTADGPTADEPTEVEPTEVEPTAFVEVPEAILEAALEEGELTWYVADNTEPGGHALADAFMARYPEIRVSVLRLTTGAMASRFATEYESGVHAADFLSIGNTEMLVDHPEWFKTLDPEEIPMIAQYRPEFVLDDRIQHAGNRWDLAYNTDLVAEGDLPQTWEEANNPRWAGQVLMVDPRGTPTIMQILAILRDHFGDEFLVGMGNLDLVLTDSLAPGTQQLAAGAVAMGFPFTGVHLAELLNAGAPVNLVRMDEPLMLGRVFAVLPSEAQNPNAAKLLMNWFLSPEARDVLCEVPGSYVVTMDDYEGECAPYPEQNPDTVFFTEHVPEDEQDEILELLGLSR